MKILPGLFRRDKRQRDFDPSRRRLLKILGAGAVAGALASASIAYAHHIPFISPENVVDSFDIDKLKGSRLPFVQVFLDKCGRAVARGMKGERIAGPSTDHWNIIQEALAYAREVMKQYSITIGDAVIEAGSVIVLSPGTYNIDNPIELNRADGIIGYNFAITRLRAVKSIDTIIALRHF